MSVRVRFAPSPTGNLHVGSARTAIFNWLFARHHGGTFILRIEDTDRERSKDEFTRSILEGMRWLGMDWDEGPEAGGEYGPYFQGQRRHLYDEAAERMLASGHAYRCFCTPERLNDMRAEQEKAGVQTRYDGLCRGVSPEESSRRAGAGERFSVRLRMDETRPIEWTDLCKGPISIGAELLDDLVLVKSDGFPTYNFGVVVDDTGMRVTHVIRGEDHISNTPKQILIYRALGLAPPHFGHIPMILGPDRSKLSKRHGATNVVDYEAQGFLPEAFFNFLTLLGWSPESDQELFSRDGLVAAFTLERVVSHAAIFDPEKLKWMNLQYIKQLPPDDLFRRCEPFLRNLPGYPGGFDPAQLEELVGLFRERMNVLTEIADKTAYFFQAPAAYDEKGLKTALKTPDLPAVMTALADALAALEPFDHDGIERVIRSLAESRGMGAGKVIHPARLALSGRTEGPGLFEMILVLGRDRCAKRLRTFVERKPWESQE
jgi:nondiscriminating glutamyl-tRNA synthetase